MMIEPDELRDIAVRYTAAWSSHDPARVAALYSPNGSLTVNGAAPAAGRNAIRNIAEGFMTTFPDMQLLMDDVLMQDDRAIYHWTLIGSDSGPRGAGHRVRISGFEIWQLDADGLIAESQGHFDEALYQHQLNHGTADS